MWNQDISGTSAPAQAAVTGLALALARRLRRGRGAVRAAGRSRRQHRPGPDDPGVRRHRQRLLLRPAEQHVHHSVTYSAPPGQPALPQPVIAASYGRLGYDDLSKQLSFAGVLDPATQTAIEPPSPSARATAGQCRGRPTATFTPASMTNIYPGAALVIDTGAAQETVIVAAATATSFTANTTSAHNGTGTPFPITSDPRLTAAVASLAAASQQAVARSSPPTRNSPRCTPPTSPPPTRCRTSGQPCWPASCRS